MDCVPETLAMGCYFCISKYTQFDFEATSCSSETQLALSTLKVQSGKKGSHWSDGFVDKEEGMQQMCSRLWSAWPLMTAVAEDVASGRCLFEATAEILRHPCGLTFAVWFSPPGLSPRQRSSSRLPWMLWCNRSQTTSSHLLLPPLPACQKSGVRNK